MYDYPTYSSLISRSYFCAIVWLWRAFLVHTALHPMSTNTNDNNNNTSLSSQNISSKLQKLLYTLNLSIDYYSSKDRQS